MRSSDRVRVRAHASEGPDGGRARHAAARPRRAMSPRHLLASMLVALLASVALVDLGRGLPPTDVAIDLGLGPQPPKALAATGARALPSIWESLGANIGPEEQPAVFLQPASDWGSVGRDCPAGDPHRTNVCAAVPPADPSAPAERTIYTVGNSHTMLLTNALLEAVGRNPGWSTRAQGEPGCTFSYVASPENDCERLWTVATDFILENQPDLVLVMGTRSAPAGSPEDLLPGLADWISMIETRTTSEVVAVRDSPRFAASMSDCLARHAHDPAACAQPDASPDASGQAAALRAAGATWVDLNGEICPGGTCPAVRGGLATYLDANHVSASYWRTLAPSLFRALHAEIGWWPAEAYAGRYDDRTGEPASPVV